MRRFSTLTTTALALVVLATPLAAQTITGTATYLQRMMLPPGAVLTVTVEDISRADAPAVPLAELSVEDPGAPPFPFEIEVDPAAVDPSATITVRAGVRVDGRLLMTTDMVHPVLTRGAGTHVDMVMKMVPTPAARPDSDLVNTYWKILTLDGAAVEVPEAGREPHVVLHAEGTAYNATVGCNMIRGGYTLEGASLSFGPGAMTMMACPPPLDVAERRLTDVLGRVAGYTIEGEQMSLLDAGGTAIATFKAVYLQ